VPDADADAAPTAIAATTIAVLLRILELRMRTTSRTDR
jgi:hypothetical protein